MSGCHSLSVCYCTDGCTRVRVHAHKINTDRVTGNLSCSRSVGRSVGRLVAPSSAGLHLASDIRAVAHNSVKVVFLFNHGEISHYFVAIHVLIPGRNDVEGFSVRIQRDFFLKKKKKPKSLVSCGCGVPFN